MRRAAPRSNKDHRSADGHSEEADAVNEAERATVTSLGGDQAATASYILELSSELKLLAETARLDFLAYLLDMVGAEAQSVGERLASGSGRARRGA